ncbi:MAG: hypothetical protein RJA07_333 [Bacteroidota bacterium]|jgi:hypothetical protein
MKFLSSRSIYFVIIVVAIVAGFASCKKQLMGDITANKNPETHTIIDTIIRNGNTRFPSLVKINWWGDDADGFIVAYEYTFDKNITAATQWKKLKGLDSTFTLITPAGIDTADFIFSVRAIDNKGAVDESPARVRYPVKNSAPTINFTTGIYNPTYTFPVVRLYWQTNDLDGADNIDHLELIWNDTTLHPTSISATITSAIFEATTLTSNTSTTKIYPNNITKALDSVVANMKLQANNQLYIRVVDKSNAKSRWVSSYNFYVRKPSSTILLVDAYAATSPSTVSFYAQRMVNRSHPIFDTMLLFKQSAGQYLELGADDATRKKVFKLFNTIIWFGDNTATSLGIAQKTLTDFIGNGGKIFMVNTMQKLFDNNSPLLSITPAATMVEYTDTALVWLADSLALSPASGYPTLKNMVYIPVVKPMQLASGAYSLYDAHLSLKNTITNQTPYPLWVGNSSIIAADKPTGQNPHFIYSEIDLQLLNGNNNIDIMWGKMMGEFGL